MSAEQSPVTTTIDFEMDGKQTGFLKVPHSRNDSAWGSLLIPVTVVKNGFGRTALLIGGSHGGEYEGPVALTPGQAGFHGRLNNTPDNREWCFTGLKVEPELLLPQKPAPA